MAGQVSNQPMVRRGLAAGEPAALQSRGSAKRDANGALTRSESAPWGWGQAGETAFTARS